MSTTTASTLKFLCDIRDIRDTCGDGEKRIRRRNVWSEKFGKVLTRTCDLVDSFFRLMINSKSLDNETLVKNLRTKILKKIKKGK